jgi:hypothetical protein
MTHGSAEPIIEIGIARGRRLLQELGTLERNSATERARKLECWREYGAVLLPLRKRYPAPQIFAREIRDAGLVEWPAQESATRSCAGSQD